jgi:hypothetical protein
MALTSDGIGTKMVEVLRDSQDILDKSNTLYFQPHTVFYGSTGIKAPEVADMPALAVIPWGKERGEDDENRVFTFSVMLTLHDETVNTATTEKGVKVKTFRGASTLETFLDLAMTAIRNMSTEMYYNDKGFEYQPIEFFPLFMGELILTVSFPVLIGGYEPIL